MTNFKIEKEISIPPKYRKAKEIFFPLDEMEVGDSFLVVNGMETPTGRDARVALIQYASAYSKRTNKKFTTRKTDNGIRIWRFE